MSQTKISSYLTVQWYHVLLTIILHVPACQWDTKYKKSSKEYDPVNSVFRKRADVCNISKNNEITMSFQKTYEIFLREPMLNVSVDCQEYINKIFFREMGSILI